MPPIETYLKPLDILDATVAWSLKPTFTVLIMSPGLLHESASPRLSKSILGMLQQGLCARLELVSLQSVGISQQRRVLVLIGTPLRKLMESEGLCSTAALKQLNRRPGTIQGCLRDLLSQASSDSNSTASTTLKLHNHQTTHKGPRREKRPVDLEANIFDVSNTAYEIPVHPGKYH